MASRQTLKGFFKTGSFPTEGQFATLIDSFVSVDEGTITVEKVAGLQTTLGGKASTEALTYETTQRVNGDTDLQEQINELAADGGGRGLPAGGTTGQVLSKASNADGDAQWVPRPADGADGADGTNGQGVPTGGTTGQILKKTSNANYATQWADAPTSGSSGYAARAFNQTLVFDANFKMVYNQVANVVFALGAAPVDDVEAKVIIVGDGVHSCTFPVGWINANGQLFDNRKENRIYFEYGYNKVLYSIVGVPTPDVTAPVLVSAVISNANKNKVVLTYSELLNEDFVPSVSDFSANLSKAISAVSVLGSAVTLTVSSDYAYGDAPTINYTPGGNKIQDAAGNFAAVLAAQAITNNIAVAVQSAYITANNQALKTTVRPNNILWGGAGGDVPFSVSFWIKRLAGNNDSYIYDMVSINNSPSTENLVYLRSGNLIEWVFVGSGAHVFRSVNTIATSTWTHVVLTADGSGTIGGLKMYFNGVLQSVTTPATGYTALSADLPADLRLSVLSRPLTGSTDNLYNVQLASLYFWMHEITSSEVTALYNGGHLVDPTTLTFAATLKARYEFNGNALDSSASGYNLASTATPTYTPDTP